MEGAESSETKSSVWYDEKTSDECLCRRVIFLATGFRDIYARYANGCFDEDAGAFVSLDRAVDGLKSGAVKFDRLSLRSPPDSRRLLREFKTYCDRLRVGDPIRRARFRDRERTIG